MFGFVECVDIGWPQSLPVSGPVGLTYNSFFSATASQILKAKFKADLLRAFSTGNAGSYHGRRTPVSAHDYSIFEDEIWRQGIPILHH